MSPQNGKKDSTKSLNSESKKSEKDMQSPDGRRYEGTNLIASRRDASGGGVRGTVTAQTHPDRPVTGDEYYHKSLRLE